MTRWRATRRVALAAALIALVVALIGATFQGVSTALERRRFQRPGRMVEVGEHQLHVHCTGAGRPTVVLEAPLGGLSASWADVQPRLAQEFQVCSYDRSGLGWSETGDGPFVPERATAELRTALDAVGARGPFLLVGRGFGAALARRFARLYPTETAGLVLVDPPEPTSPAPPTRSPWLARLGVLRAVEAVWPPGTSAPTNAVAHAFSYRPDHLARTVSESRAWQPVVADMSQPLPPDVPVRVVTADPSDADPGERVVQAVRTLAPTP